MISMDFDIDKPLLEANGVFRIRLLGSCQDIGAPGSLFGDDRLGLSDSGRLDNWTRQSV